LLAGKRRETQFPLVFSHFGRFFRAIPWEALVEISPLSPWARRAIFPRISLCGDCVTLLTSCYGQEMCAGMAAIIRCARTTGQRRQVKALVFCRRVGRSQ